MGAAHPSPTADLTMTGVWQKDKCYVLSILVIAYILLSNDFPVMFHFFINIHEYANEIIYM